MRKGSGIRFATFLHQFPSASLLAHVFFPVPFKKFWPNFCYTSAFSVSVFDWEITLRMQQLAYHNPHQGLERRSEIKITLG
jgi:hypothetical protein